MIYVDSIKLCHRTAGKEIIVRVGGYMLDIGRLNYVVYYGD
jgi:hypothetical protein